MRDWLGTAAGGTPLPGGKAIAGRFAAFTADLPGLAAALRLTVEELTFGNYVTMASEWLRRDLAELGDPLA